MEKHQQIYRKGGISVIYSDFVNQAPLQEESAKNEADRMWVFSFCLEGNTAYCDRSGAEVRFYPGHCVACIHQACMGYRMSAAGKVRQLRLAVQEHELTEYFGIRKIQALTNRTKSIKHLFDKALEKSTGSLIKSVLWHLHHQDFLQIHMNILGLLHENMSELGVISSAVPNTSTCQRDIILVNEARRLIDEDCTRRISEVAAALNVTEQKLRMAFTQCLDTSPSQYITQTKMNKAKSLLRQGISVNEVAYMLGYEFPNNFTYAFKKYFGRAPSLMCTVN